MIKAVVFDIGGVLLDYGKRKKYEDVFAESFKAEKSRLVELVSKDLEQLQRGEIDDREYWTRYANALGEQLPEDYATLWERAFLETSDVNHEMVDLARNLKQRGYKIATLSNTINSHAKILRKIYDPDIFDAFALSNELGMRKPEERIYLEALRQLKCKPEDSIYVDDDVKFVAPAQKLGMCGIIFQSKEKLLDDLKFYLAPSIIVDKDFMV